MLSKPVLSDTVLNLLNEWRVLSIYRILATIRASLFVWLKPIRVDLKAF